MKKKVLTALFIIIGIVIVLLVINYIKEKKDASTEFLLDNENKYRLSYSKYMHLGGFNGPYYYYEIDLNNKYIDCRYDYDQYSEFGKVSKLKAFINIKKRKLVKRYRLTNEESETLKKLFERFINELELNDLDLTEINYYYFLEREKGSIMIKNLERKEELEQTLKNIDEDLYSFLLNG